MSVFADKVKKRLVPTEEEWESHLIEAHAREPHMTPEAFAGFSTAEGKNSYATLAEFLPIPARDVDVLDLGCGDGHLIPYLLPRLGSGARVTGIDISPEGLQLARAHNADPRVSFIQGRAQSLPLREKSINYVLSHMAFMLMSPIEPVVQEIRRVLRPRGIFAAIVSGGTKTGVYREITRLTGLYVQAHLPQFMEARKGSSNVNSPEGLAQLFARDVSIREFHLRYHVPPEGVIEYVKNMYYMPLLPESVRHELYGDLLALARENGDADGKVLFHVPLKCLSVEL